MHRLSATTSTASGSPTAPRSRTAIPPTRTKSSATSSRAPPADVDAAAAAAAGGLPGLERDASGPARGNILYKAADILDRNFESIAADMTREEGKTLPEAKGEVRRAINIFRYFAGEGSRMPGMLVPSRARPRPHVRACASRSAWSA